MGRVTEARAPDIDAALACAQAAQNRWNERGDRAAILERAAQLLEARREQLIGLLGAEAGRTLADALAEVREAVDFCRYYALQARQRFGKPMQLPGPTGERNDLSLHGRGVFACISPWNFPLAIFTGQVTAALAAGNSVVAKPAEQDAASRRRGRAPAARGGRAAQCAASAARRWRTGWRGTRPGCQGRGRRLHRIHGDSPA